ncbi:MAG TPA: GGDEF domain-containing protein [Rhodocyclaceae bacterium]
MALPLMSKQAAGLHPVSYAVWYEYVAGRNPALRARIDEALQGGAVLDEGATHDLFRRHIAELDPDLAKRVSEGFQKVMADMSHSASQAGDRAQQFGTVLDRLSEGMLDPSSAAMLGVGMETLREQTRDMRGAVSTLKVRLDESRREIEQLRQEVAKAREDALADALTGLLNRRGFDMALKETLAGREAGEAGPSLLMVDIDHFKRVNDNYGHLFGDKVIRAVAHILKDNVKGKDIAARYGGEEFVILLPDTPLGGAGFVAEKIRSTVEKCRIKRADSKEVVANVTVSVGVACFSGKEAGPDFVARADAALYESKNCGRNRVSVSGAA